MSSQNKKYPAEINYSQPLDDLNRYVKLAAEFGYQGEAEETVRQFYEFVGQQVDRMDTLVRNALPDPEEPETLEEIRAHRPQGERRLCAALPADYRERWLGSFLGRGAGCTLGAALEFCEVDEMEKWAAYFGDEYPLRDYWSRVKNPYTDRYIVGKREDLTRNHMKAIPVDDDMAYTLVGLLTLEQYGPNFTQEQMLKVWEERLPLTGENGSFGIYWGERQMMLNRLAGLPADQAGFVKNPNVQSVAAWTRADTWGYVAPGWPEKAAELAFRDASTNHRRNGVYGEMFMAAAVAAAFAVDDPVEALRIALQEIPANCQFAQGVQWALEVGGEVTGYRQAAQMVRKRYDGMFKGHAVNNGLFVVLGILIGQKDFTKVIGETIAMGYDNDCTGATAGSIVGAVVGKRGIPAHWYQPFQNRMHSYLKGCPEYLDVNELALRYEKQAKIILK